MRLMQNEPGRRGSRPSKDRKQPIVVFFGGPGFPPRLSAVEPYPEPMKGRSGSVIQGCAPLGGGIQVGLE